MDKEQIRNYTEFGLINELNKILRNYMIIYDEYYSEQQTRDSAFLKDLVDSLKGISAVLEVYVRDKKIHYNYAIEKLNFAESIIKSVKNYYEYKKESEEE